MTIFQKIINKEIPANILFEDERVIAIYDINPEREGHFLVIPKNHSVNLFDISADDLSYVMVKAKELAKKECERLGKDSFNIKINNGEKAGQEVFHTHVHVIPA